MNKREKFILDYLRNGGAPNAMRYLREMYKTGILERSVVTFGKLYPLYGLGVPTWLYTYHLKVNN